MPLPQKKQYQLKVVCGQKTITTFAWDRVKKTQLVFRLKISKHKRKMEYEVHLSFFYFIILSVNAQPKLKLRNSGRF